MVFAQIPLYLPMKMTGAPILKYSGTCLERLPIGRINVVSQDRWSLVTGSITLKCWTFCQEYLVFQDRSSHGSGLKTGVTVSCFLSTVAGSSLSH